MAKYGDQLAALAEKNITSLIKRFIHDVKLDDSSGNN